MFYTSHGRHRESYISPVHSSSGDCCQLYTVGRRRRDCLAATFGRHRRLARTHTRVANTHILKCVFCERSDSRRTLEIFRKHLIHGPSCLPTPSPSATHACTHAHKLVYPLRDSHSGRQCTCAVYRLHMGSSAGEEMRVEAGGGLEKREETVREQRRVLLPSTRTPSALYDNVRVQERQS